MGMSESCTWVIRRDTDKGWKGGKYCDGPSMTFATLSCLICAQSYCCLWVLSENGRCLWVFAVDLIIQAIHVTAYTPFESDTRGMGRPTGETACDPLHGRFDGDLSQGAGVNVVFHGRDR